MSAFLGPIHYWLYRKIQIQEEMIRAVCLCAEEHNFPEFTEELKTSSISEELRPLEELIDTANIHGWLQDRIHDAEGRYANLVTVILKNEDSRIENLKNTLFKLGTKYQVDATADAQDAYRALDDSLLNGMPCDRVNVVSVNSVEKVSWSQEVDIHREYWDTVGGDFHYYYILRRAFMEGVLEGSKLKLEEEGEYLYSISTI